MANKTIDDLSAAGALTGAERFHLVQGSNSRKATADQLRGFAPGGTAALTQGDLLYVGLDGVITRLPKGTSGQVLRQNSDLTAPEWHSPVFSRSYESAEQIITLNGGLTLAHGLAGRPLLDSYILRCKTAEAGYDIGDEISVAPGYQYDGGSVANFAVERGSSSLTIRFSARFNYYQKGNSGSITLTPGSWRLVARAWR